ncbi:transposase [Aestuariivirga sp.]|jgi:hypothetical protein|uniref:transposase n=1 Tax=Aestuariivirga sp. TaxID=2650926 RepID=UPI003783AE37
MRKPRERAPEDQRIASAYIFGAICPYDGKGTAFVLPACNVQAMDLHLTEISAEVAPGRHAVMLLHQPGWHMSARLRNHCSITLLALPPKCPELNPTENLWQFMRDNSLSNRTLKSYEDILDHCCFAWNKFIGQSWRITSIGLKDWAQTSCFMRIGINMQVLWSS